MMNCGSVSPKKKRERNELEQQILVETSSHPTPTVK